MDEVTFKMLLRDERIYSCFWWRKQHKEKAFSWSTVQRNRRYCRVGKNRLWSQNCLGLHPASATYKLNDLGQVTGHLILSLPMSQMGMLAVAIMQLFGGLNGDVKHTAQHLAFTVVQ